MTSYSKENASYRPPFLLEIGPTIERLNLSPHAAVAVQAALYGRDALLAYRKQASSQEVVAFKQDNTPLLASDLKSSRMIAEFLLGQHSDTAVLDEEQDWLVGQDWVHGDDLTVPHWEVDPQDGSRNARKGVYELVTVGAGRVENGVFTTAAIVHALSGDVIVAERGRGAFKFNPHEIKPPAQLHISGRATMHHADISIDGLDVEPNARQKLSIAQRIADLSVRGVVINEWRIGSNILGGSWVAQGVLDVQITDCRGIYCDTGIPALVVEESKGKATDVEGNPITRGTQVAVFSNGVLHEQALNLVEGYVTIGYPGGFRGVNG